LNDGGLDNPFFSALATRHGALARRHGEVARYPAEYAPFLGVADPDVDAGEALEALVAPDETVLLLGVVPRPPAGWVLEPQGELAQMVRDAPLEMPAGPGIVPLGDRDRDDVLDLVARVYPHYFRARTMDLGRYFGIREDGRLSAMIGERLGTDAATELSAICTDPACTGRGLARRLMAHLANDLLGRGHLPFLHVAQHNTRAVALYERVGFRLRRTIPFFALRRAQSP
jgi:ribosomal protein S18 acetylase RimI-like enzyme